MGRLYIWSPARGAWISCPTDEITWLDRERLSGNEDLTLHRAPRCAGLRYVHHRWELFSRDQTHPVYLAANPGGTPSVAAVQGSAKHVLPAAQARYEARAVPLEEGAWLVSIGSWVLPLRLEQPARPATQPGGRAADSQPPTQDSSIVAAASGRRGTPPRADAVPRVRAYFDRNRVARLAMAYYYQEFILGLAAPQTIPMADVVVGMDLSGEGAVSDLKKLLQGLIWQERGHARDLADFLLSQGLLGPADLAEARQVVADNERRGVTALARQRLQYRPKGT
jgi:hypothetical protein